MKKILCGLLACTVATISVPSWADSSSREYTFELSRSTLRSVLTEFSRQTGLQTFFSPESAAEENTVVGPLKGHYTVDTALNRLLASTGLSFKRVNERTIALIALDAAKSPRRSDRVASGGETSKGSPEFVRLIDRRYGGGLDGAPGFQRIADTQSLQSAAEDEQGNAGKRKVDVLAEVVVTGTNIRGLENNTLPVIVLDKAYIDSTGLSTTTALIETIPQNFALANPAGVLVPGVSGPRTQGASINLRGLGEGTTLVLLNGRRMASGFVGSAVDIAALPLSAIERVEVLTDGASAVYGSDAVGGVVNFILRRDYDGSETRLRSGWDESGVNEYRLSQVLGNKWNSGNALVSLEYYDRDLLKTSDRDFVPSASQIGSLFPQDKNYSAMLSGRQSLTDAVDVFTDALYTKRDSYHQGGRTTLNETYKIDNPQVTATAGIDWRVGEDWRIESAGGYASNDMSQAAESSADTAAGRGAALSSNRFEIVTARVQADGSLFELPGGVARMAAGLEWREDSLHYKTRYENRAVAENEEDFEQTVYSAFFETYVPVVGAANKMRAANLIEISLAGRFDDYSSFGSSFDPRVGVLWEPLGGLRFRGSYGTSYVAPKLSSYSASTLAALAFTDADPGSPTGVSHQLQVYGNDINGYSAQESHSASFGLEFQPGSAPDLQMAVNYYWIKYKDRIADPPPASVMLSSPSSFGGLFIRNPSVAQVQQYVSLGEAGGHPLEAYDPDFNPDVNFDPSSVEVIVDGRSRNLSVVETSGLDGSVEYGIKAGESAFHFGLAATYILGLEQQITSTSAVFDTVDTFYNPPSWRLRGSFNWRRQGWSANLFVNYTDSYTDNRRTIPIPVSSYTTADLSVSYNFSDKFREGFLSGVSVSAIAQNLLDTDPPHTAIVSLIRDMGFDPTNASPMGRFLAIEVVKSW